jgi:UDP-N-acetylmuramate dehydrogenase
MTIHRDYSLATANYLRLDVKARFFAVADSINAIRSGLQFAHSRDLPVLILGEGSNVVFTEDYRGLVLRISTKGIKLTRDESTAIVEVAAGEHWQDLVTYTLDNELYGLENLSMIPGSVGAAPVQNIGAYGAELRDVLLDLNVLDRQSLTENTLTSEACEFGYRDSIFKGKDRSRYVITSIRLKLARQSRLLTGYGAVQQELQDMQVTEVTGKAIAKAVARIRSQRLPDPAKEANVGSFFKNPLVPAKQYQKLQVSYPDMPGHQDGDRVKLSAAWLIDQCGLKGTSCGDAVVSTRHSLVLINKGLAKPDDFVKLKNIIQSTVLEHYGLALDVEPYLVD